MRKEEKEYIKSMLIKWGEAPEKAEEKRAEAEALSERIKAEKALSFDGGEIRKSVIDAYKERISALALDSAELIKLEGRVYAALSRLSKPERDVINLRYKYGISWDFIAEKVNFSRMQCFRIHNRALEKIKDLL